MQHKLHTDNNANSPFRECNVNTEQPNSNAMGTFITTIVNQVPQDLLLLLLLLAPHHIQPSTYTNVTTP